MEDNLTLSELSAAEKVFRAWKRSDSHESFSDFIDTEFSGLKEQGDSIEAGFTIDDLINTVQVTGVDKALTTISCTMANVFTVDLKVNAIGGVESASFDQVFEMIRPIAQKAVREHLISQLKFAVRR